MQSWLVVGTKLSGAFLSGLMPLALAARRNVSPEFIRAWDASWEQAELASLFCLVLLTLRPSLVSASAVRDAGVAYLLISLALVVAPASSLMEAALPFLFLACHVCFWERSLLSCCTWFFLRFRLLRLRRSFCSLWRWWGRC
jgi:hypothetical protein